MENIVLRIKNGGSHRFRRLILPIYYRNFKPKYGLNTDEIRKTKIIVFDVETNGLKRNYSVLSCSAIKYEIDPITYSLTEIGRFNRYYYPVEPYEPSAIAVNGLTEEVLSRKRADADYPEHFHKDPDYEAFCSDTKRFVAHNISFDSRFVPHLKGKKKFCTMITNTDIVAAGYIKHKREWKRPKLSETATHYDIYYDDNDLHESMIDVEITAKIFMAMLERAKNNASPLEHPIIAP